MKSRREILYLYDIRKGNPNGDPDENRPRVFPDGTYYVTDVRLKRFVRDYLKQQGHDILVDKIGDKVTNLTGRVSHHLEQQGQNDLKDKGKGAELVEAILESFIDARMFGSSLAFKKEGKWEPKPEPKTLTGPVQFNHGEVLHKASEIEIYGTSVFASSEEKTQGTFTSYYGLQYGLIGFHGIVNEHSARLSKMTGDDYELLLKSLWRGVRSANTRTKIDQVPRLLLSIEYKEGSDFQLGDLLGRVCLSAADGKAPEHWTSPSDYCLDTQRLLDDLKRIQAKVERVRLQLCSQLVMSHSLQDGLGERCELMDLDQLGA